MSLDYTGADVARVTSPLIAMLADDELAARRIEAVLAADRMLVAIRARRTADIDIDSAEPDVLIIGCGRGITERDHQMRRVRRAFAQAAIVAVMPEDSRRGVRRALEAGADGVVFENRLETSLALTVRSVMAGQTVVPAAGRLELDRPTLSAREKQVLGMVVAGLSNKAIASELYLAESTVKCHLSSAFSKLGVRSRNEAADLILHSGRDGELGVLAAPPAFAGV
ncbi:MAG: response regulator transcription factor [Solirubrobacterales bacterium]|nr:response regulator transcription factor [Solirubrobacterales bacterium]